MEGPPSPPPLLGAAEPRLDQRAGAFRCLAPEYFGVMQDEDETAAGTGRFDAAEAVGHGIPVAAEPVGKPERVGQYAEERLLIVDFLSGLEDVRHAQQLLARRIELRDGAEM